MNYRFDFGWLLHLADEDKGLENISNMKATSL
jgi:hypothetical protein